MNDWCETVRVPYKQNRPRKETIETVSGPEAQAVDEESQMPVLQIRVLKGQECATRGTFGRRKRKMAKMRVYGQTVIEARIPRKGPR